MAFVLIPQPKYTFHFFPRFPLGLPYYSYYATNIIDEHYLRAIKTRYLWQTRVHIQPLPSPPTKNDFAMNILSWLECYFHIFGKINITFSCVSRVYEYTEAKKGRECRRFSAFYGPHWIWGHTDRLMNCFLSGKRGS